MEHSVSKNKFATAAAKVLIISSEQAMFCLALVYWVPLASFASLPSLSHCNSQIIGEAIERYP